MNNTRKKVLAEGFRNCKSIFSQARGLMFSGQKNLVFPQRKSKKVPLHMLFVFFPIDVLYLDKDKRVVEIKERLMPFNFYAPREPCRYVLELREGIVKETGTKKGDLLCF